MIGQAWYDNAGNVIHNSSAGGESGGTRGYTDVKNWRYDAAGRMVYWDEHGPWGNDTRSEWTDYDGDGRAVRHDDAENSLTWYYVNSSVTGERITDLAIDGSFVANHIYMGSTKVAENWGSEFGFIANDPVSSSTATMIADGTTEPHNPNFTNETAGLGMSVPLVPLQTYPPLDNYIEGGFVGHAESGCEWNGSPIPCGMISLVTRGYKNVTINVNIRSDGGWALYSGLQSQIRTWRFNIYKEPKPLTPDKTPDDADTIKIRTDRQLLGTFYASFLSETTDYLFRRIEGNRDNTCTRMVRILEAAVAENLRILGGPEKIATHAGLDQLVSFIDTTFNDFYVGEVVNSGLKSKGPPPGYAGEDGFKEIYQDHEDDQTHHFARFFRAGIRGENIKAWGQSTFWDSDNKKDRLLGELAYSLGADLNKRQVGTEFQRVAPGPDGLWPMPVYEAVSDRLSRILGLARSVRLRVCQ